jgi:hypothetical protein
VNGQAVEEDGEVLSDGDMISLGSSHVSTYVLVSIGDDKD